MNQFSGECDFLNNYFCTNSGCAPCPPQPPCPPEPQRPGCPCANEFRHLLNLICGTQLRPLIDFTSFAFVSDFYLLGTTLIAPVVGTAPSDNLADPAGTYICGSDGCETATVSGQLYAPTVESTALGITVTQAALCRLKALSFDALAVDGDATANFQTISQTLSQLLRPQRPQDCGSMIDALTGAAAIRASTVAAGPLVISNSAILGQMGDVLVMANSTDNRFYFICANQIDYIG